MAVIPLDYFVRFWKVSQCLLLEFQQINPSIKTQVRTCSFVSGLTTNTGQVDLGSQFQPDKTPIPKNPPGILPQFPRP